MPLVKKPGNTKIWLHISTNRWKGRIAKFIQVRENTPRMLWVPRDKTEMGSAGTAKTTKTVLQHPSSVKVLIGDKIY